MASNNAVKRSSSSVDIPFGMGAPIKPDNQTELPFAKCELARSQGATLGRPAIFEHPEQLAHACVEYFKWCQDHPFYETVSRYDKDIGWVDHEVPKRRPWTKNGLELYLGISVQSWKNWSQDEKFAEVVARVNKALYDQKISGAMSGFFNASVVMRVLGIADKTEVSGPDGGPIETESKVLDLSKLTDDQLAAAADLLRSVASGKSDQD